MNILNRKKLELLTDEQLMRSFQAGSEESFSLLIDRYRNRLYNYIIRYTCCHEDTEDILQEAFLRVYHSRNAYEEVARFSTWLYTIAGNLMRTQFRRRQRMALSSISRFEEEGGSEMELKDDGCTPEDLVNSSLAVTMIRKAMRQLPAEYAELLSLREYKDMSYEEISLAVNLPMGTVKSRINRGRSRLQSILSQMMDKESIHYAA
jgi:RNA polymerase sigma-70 factor (ECF subfamily)